MGGGGAERVVSILANSLAVDKNNDVSVFTIVGGESFYPLRKEICYESVGASISKKNVFARTISKAVFFPKALIHIYRKLKQGKYDIVISMLPETDILVGLCKCLGLKFNHVCSERNDPTKRSKFQFATLNAIYKKAALFVCQGKKAYDFYVKVPQEIKCIIPNPVDGASLPVRPEIYSKRIVSVGRLNPQKNFSLLIRSFARISNLFPDYNLDIYGEGPERAMLEALISDMGVDGRVNLRGAVKNVKECIADAELFVMSSNHEGFPNALLEAMAIGLPVISTDFPTGIAAELISHENGIVVPLEDETALANAMQILLSNDQIRWKMGAINRKKSEKYYSDNILSQWKEQFLLVAQKTQCKTKGAQ